jgi:heterotetrameric sarcosine oxidase gamma subunit
MAETWTAASAWTAIAPPSASAGAGLTVTPLDMLGLASVHARRGAQAELAARVKTAYAVALPDRPCPVASGEVAFVGLGPGAWMAVTEAGPSGWADRLAADLDGLASVNDQSDAYAALRLEGPAVLDVLAKGVFLDLHDSVFPVGSAAGVSVAHIGAVLWRREPQVFEILTLRSYAASFWQWVEESAAEYGMAVRG